MSPNLAKSKLTPPTAKKLKAIQRATDFTHKEPWLQEADSGRRELETWTKVRLPVVVGLFSYITC